MNFFFGLKSSFLSSSIIIPKFQNYGILSKDLRVFEANIENDMWIIKETQVREKDNFFFYR